MKAADRLCFMKGRKEDTRRDIENHPSMLESSLMDTLKGDC